MTNKFAEKGNGKERSLILSALLSAVFTGHHQRSFYQVKLLVIPIPIISS
jgi:hypothetical protein